VNIVVLRNKAILVLDKGEPTGPLQFHLSQPERTGGLTKEMLIGNRGQLLASLAKHLPVDLGGLQGSNAAGFSLDAGLGRHFMEIEFVATPDPENDFQWGDGSRDPDTDPITLRDATGGHPQSRMQILEYHARTARTDSRSPARLHWGEHTDGIIGGEAIGGVEAGVFDEPMPAVVLEVSPRNDRDDSGAVTGTVICQRVKEFPEVDFGEGFDELADELGEEFENIADTTTDFISNLP
jgi:hypothetical protein